MVRRGRPRKKAGSKKAQDLRKQWRKASAKYYKDNKKKILKRSKTKPKRRKK